MPFPTTSILDNFNRANEGPPPGANWIDDVIDGYPGLRLISNAVQLQAGDSGADESFWNASIGPDLEIYITINSVSVNCSFQIHARLNVTNPFTRTGYYLNVVPGITGGWLFYRRDTGFSDVILASGSETFAIGDKAGFSIVGSAITIYRYTSGAWSQIGTASDGAYSGSGYLSLLMSDLIAADEFSLDDFGGGTLGGGPTPPVADFSGTPATGTAGLSVDFTDLSTNTPTSWLWDFGDGNASTDQNPTNVYVSPGTYTVALTATNGDGSDTETKVDYITVLSAPVADFSGTPTSGNVALSVDFTDLSTNSPTSWFWDFGDGGSSINQNPTYIYSYIGVYTVTLTATSSSGSDSETKVAYITVNAVPEVGAAEIEDCDVNTGGLAVGMRVSNVALARDNWLGSLTIDAAAELRAKDNSYSTLVNNGTLQPLAGDRAVFDALGYAARHTNDADDSVTAIHHTLGTGADQAAAGDHTHVGMGTVTNIATGTGLTGGPITSSGTISDANTGVVAATYGDESNIPQIAINAQGRITSASNIAISTFTPVNVYNETQTADGTSLIYYLVNYAAPGTIRSYIDGIRQPISDDDDPTDVVTFSSAPSAGALLLFDYEMDI